ncbi:MAG: hypothetical protein GF331_15040 [Chitinivibrionales bacterium]|nr:hypothetical protein [Chitinivibrionales bacterium]
MLRFVVEGLLIYFIIHTLWGLFRPGMLKGSRKRKKAGRSGNPRRFDTSNRDVSDADFEEVAD